MYPKSSKGFFKVLTKKIIPFYISQCVLKPHCPDHPGSPIKKKRSPQKPTTPFISITNPEVIKALTDPNFKFDLAIDDPVFKSDFSKNVKLSASSSKTTAIAALPLRTVFHFDVSGVADLGVPTVDWSSF